MKPEATLPNVMDLRNPQKTVHFSKGRIDLFSSEGNTVARLTLEPGWRWSSHKNLGAAGDIKFATFVTQVSGKLRCRMPTGVEVESQMGDLTYLSSGYDSWVVGEEPVVVVG